MPTTLSTPTITATVIDRTKIKIDGLSVQNASGYQIRWGTLSGYGRRDTIVPTNGEWVLEDTRCRTTYYISARALGDDETYANSDWSTEVIVVTGQVIDNTIAIPVISLGSVSYTYVQFTGLETDKAYRYQIATSADALDNQNPKVIGAGTGTVSNSRIQGLAPGTTYYVRFCAVAPLQRCSLWTDVISFTTTATTSSVVVTTAADTGTGSLRQAIVTTAANGAKITFDSSLSGQTINVASSISSTKNVVIDASSLPNGITLDFGAVSGRNLLAANAHWIGVNFTNVLHSANNQFFGGGAYVNCSFSNMTTNVNSQNYHLLSNLGMYNCRVSGCSSNNTQSDVIFASYIDSCFVSGCTAGLLRNAAAINCCIENQAANAAVVCHTDQLVGCVVYEATGSVNGFLTYGGRAVECSFTDNYCSNTTNYSGMILNTYLHDCRVERNSATTSYCGVCYGTGAYYDSVFKDNTARNGDGVGTGTYERCIIIEALTRQCTFGSAVMHNCLVIGKVIAGEFRNCTLANMGNQANVTPYNCLLGPTSLSPTKGANNITWNESDSENTYYYNKIFIDKENGDYRLEPDAPVIEQGSNSYVTTTLDLGNNPRIAGTNVDLGCYEFVPVQLPTPTLYLDAGHDQATIYFTLPPYCDGYLIEHADNPDFTDALTTTATSTGFLLPGLSGETYIRAKYVGVSGKTLDSEWSEVYEHYFDITAPTVIVNALYDPIIMTVGDSIDLFSGVTVTDDYDEEVIPTYEILDGDNETVEIGGETIDLPSNALPVGNYTIKYTATDQAGNTATSLRSLSVRPPVLDTPVIAYHSATTDTITVSGVLDEFADGWEVEVNGSVSTATPNSAGLLLVGGLRVTNLYNIKVKAIGNGITTSDSEWSNTVIASPSPAVIAYSDIHIKNAPTGEFSAVRKIDLDSRVPTGGEYGEVIVWGTSGPEWTPGVIPIWRVVNGE